MNKRYFANFNIHFLSFIKTWYSDFNKLENIKFYVPTVAITLKFEIYQTNLNRLNYSLFIHFG